ncbi:MAG: DUF1801 domain-containing protein [Bacteroidetes bacterium]|nr:DUF1801 domain-containing protein [Bacteroidota bacterium]
MFETSPEVDAYYNQLQEPWRSGFHRLRTAISQNIPTGFVEGLSYGMPAFVVPHHVYPAGYHCKPSEPLPFISIAAQKKFLAIYHMGIYAHPPLMDWFLAEWAKKCAAKKLDKGKSCIRFSKPEEIPFDLIAEMAGKMTMDEWIGIYEETYNGNIRK